VVAASTVGFPIDGIETEFLRADCTSEFSRNQDPERTLPQWAYRAPLGFDLKH